LYNYFEGGKEDILLAIFDEIYDDLCGLVGASFTDEAMEAHSIRSLFEDFITACLSYYMDRQDLFMILVKEAHRMIFGDDDARVAYFVGQHGRVVKALARPLALGMERGALRPLPPEAVAHMLLGNINGCQMQIFLERRSCPDKPTDAPAEAAAFLTQMLFDGLLADPQPALHPNAQTERTD
ncbi:MAG: TetR/AcrR family transcriptional regulator, partial [Rhodothermaceae bacterium]|nr:TetR/AcrR family transcriptional regulator [Rhodothermaceae bacterium]